MVRDNEDGSTRLVDAHFHTEVVRNLEETDKEEVFKPSVITILERLWSYNEEGSNWRFQRVTSLNIHLVKYKPLSGSSHIEHRTLTDWRFRSSGLGSNETPRELQTTAAISNAIKVAHVGCWTIHCCAEVVSSCPCWWALFLSSCLWHRSQV